MEASGDLAALFSRKLRVGGIGAEPVRQRVQAAQHECAALAAAFGLQGIGELAGDFTLRPARGGGQRIDCTLALRARVTQLCVVSLEPFEAAVTETAKLVFIPAPAPEGPDGPETPGLEAPGVEAPDEIPYSGGMLDLGAALAEQLALALDPYPRRPGAELPAGATDDPGGPFAALIRPPPANDG